MKLPASLEKLHWERLLAGLIGLTGIMNLVSAVRPAVHTRLLILEEFFPLFVRTGTRLATAFAGFALIMLASGIWRSKRNAWYLTLAILVITFFTHLLKGIDVEEASLTLVIIAIMLVLRNRFQAKSDAPTIQRGLVAIAAALIFTFIYSTLGFYLLDRHFAIRFTLGGAASQTVRMFTEFQNPGQIATTRYGKYFTDSIYGIGALTMIYALIALLAPVLIRLPSSLGEREQASDIVNKYGRTVLARFCLYDDKHYFFSLGGSLIAYALRNRTAVVLGDPIGPPDDVLPAIQAFEKHCSNNDWQLAFYQTLADTLEVYHAAGLRTLKIGEEAIVDLASFSLQGGEIKSVRTSVNKMERLGFSCQVSQPPHSDELLDKLNAISDEWILERKAKEMKYSMGWFDRTYLNTTPIISMVDPDGTIIGFVNLVDEYQNRELAVDLMRQIAHPPAGAMDYLFANMLLKGKEWHYERFNLGLSGLAGVGESSSDPAIERALHFIYSRINTSYNFRGLHSFKEKFSPKWSPRYLIYPSLASLPTIAIALNDLSS